MLHKATTLICLLVALVVAEMASGQQQTNCTLQTTKPEPKVYKYVFQDCIVGQFGGYFTNRAYDKYLAIENGTVNLLQSSCNVTNDQSPKLVIDFTCGNISLNFKRTPLNQTYVDYISGTLHSNDSNSTLVFSNSTPLFNTSAPGHYYKCDTEQTLIFETVSLTLKNVALEVYRNASGTDFYQIPDECSMDSQPISNLVRIGVGVCLLALVAIVIIAYFVGRRRWTERSTYESV